MLQIIALGFIIIVIVLLLVFLFKKSDDGEDDTPPLTGTDDSWRPVQGSDAWKLCKDDNGNYVDWGKSKKIVDQTYQKLRYSYWKDKPWWDPGEIFSNSYGLRQYNCPVPPDGKLANGYGAPIDRAKQSQGDIGYGDYNEFSGFDWRNCPDKRVDYITIPKDATEYNDYVQKRITASDVKKGWTWKYVCAAPLPPPPTGQCKVDTTGIACRGCPDSSDGKTACLAANTGSNCCIWVPN